MSKILPVALLLLFLRVYASNVYAASDIVINEFVAKPSSNNTEWVEFYNPTDSTIDLSDFYFDDDADLNSDSGTSSKVALSGLLESKKTCYWDLPSYLNNNGDSPTLFKVGQNSPIDTYTYSTADTDNSYSRIPEGGDWQSKQTPTKSETKCQDLAPKPSPSPPHQNVSTAQTSPVSSPKVTTQPSPSSSSKSSKSVLSAKTSEPTSLSTQTAQTTPSAMNVETPSPSPAVNNSNKAQIPKIAGVLIGSSFVLFSLSLGLYLWYRKRFLLVTK